ncbi:MAG TPA: FtsQ-type POTRA domain-containing protein [Acidobacteriaceae bacterium]|nr:FtsQ-type POTRA domain-containing protein [Acidobacteriaceae bacterium]
MADRIGVAILTAWLGRVAKNSYTTRTTLWDDESVDGPAAPQGRGAWRAPSAVLAGERGRRAAVAAPVRAAEEELDEEIEGVERSPRSSKAASRRSPRASRFAAKRPWWRPASTFGQVLLGLAALIVLGVLVTAGVVVRRFLVENAHFRIPEAASIQSTGLSEVNRADVLPVFGEDIGRNIFFVPLKKRQKELEAIPWVQRATVMRYLPNRLSVSIVERTPVAFAVVNSQLELVDADGVLLTMPVTMMARYHFPVIHGIDANDSAESRKARMIVYQRFLSDLDKGGQHLTEQVSEIDLSNPEDLRATMPEQGSDILAHFGSDHFLERWQLYKSQIGELKTRFPRMIGVDLRYSGEMPVELAPDANSDPKAVALPVVAKKAAPVVSGKKGKTAAHAAVKKKAKGRA